MADKTKIEWTDATWNPITGCSVVSPGCTNCYAMKLAGTRLKHHPSRSGLTNPSKAGPVWNGKVTFNEQWLDQPLHWKKPRMIFVCAHGDLFAENVPDEWIDKVFAIMALCPQHTFQVLTKRADRMKEYLRKREIFDNQDPEMRIKKRAVHIAAERGEDIDHPYWDVFWKWPLPNVWLGVSVEDQTRADERIPVLLDTPAAVRFISAEPLLGPLDLSDVCNGHYFANWLSGSRWHDSPGISKIERDLPSLDWVIVGGESGRGARPMHPDWAKGLRDQCVKAGVPFFFKQWGEFLHEGMWNPCSGEVPTEHAHGSTYYRVGKKKAGRWLFDREWSEMPEVPR